MKEKALFIKALSTMLNSWGGDTPPEAIWAGNELLDWYEKEHSVKLNARLTEEEGEGTNEEAVIIAITNN
jgi:hypothetical protein